MIEEKKRKKPLPFRVYFIAVALISLVGLIDAGYLAISHYRVYTDMNHRSFCAISRAINCDSVSQSAYSIFLNVSVPVWGVFGYLIICLLLFNAWRYRNHSRKAFWPSIFIVALIYSLNSLYLAAVSSFIIHSHCMMCILSHAVNFGLLFYAWLIHKRFERTGILSGLQHDFFVYRQSWRSWSAILSSLIVMAVTLVMFFPPYWHMQVEELDGLLDRGLTAEGYPWIGAENPELIIHEFSDYQCFQCKKMHFFLRQILSEYRQKIRLVHRHFPMDEEYNPLVKTPFHSGSGKMAIISLYAQAKGQFWRVNDYLFDLGAQKKDFNTKTIAHMMDVTSGELVAALQNSYLRLRLKHDIAVGIDRGITGTPGYIINDNVYLGHIPADILKDYIK